MRHQARETVSSGPGRVSWLVCRAGARLFALRACVVIETMRPLPLETVAEAPPFLSGLSVIRGTPVPVVDLAALFGDARTQPARIVSLRTEGRAVALAVDAVIGLQPITAQSLQDLPPLLRDANGKRISALGALDAQLLYLLQSGRLIPETVWDTLKTSGTIQ